MTRPGQQAHRWVGRNVPRKEDAPLLTGRGTYVDDLHFPGMLHAAVLRSPFAHARIEAVRLEAARSAPGVVSVLDGHEAAKWVNPLASFCAEPVPQHAIAVDKVRFAGEAVAAQAMRPEAARVHDTLDSNVVFSRRFRFGPVDEDFARADRVIRRELRWRRMAAQPAEGQDGASPRERIGAL